MINTKEITFGITTKENNLIKNLLKRFGKGQILYKLRAFQLIEYLKVVEENQARVTSQEYLVAYKVSDIKKYNLEEIMAEKADIKKFAKEVGMSFSEIKGMTEDALIKAIISKVTSDVSYSEELKTWYDSLPDSVFEEGTPDIDFNELIEAIEDCQDLDSLSAILEMEEYDHIFPKKLKKISEVEELQEAMTEAIEKAMEGTKEETTTETAKKEEKEMAKEEINMEEILELVNSTDELDDLKEIIKEYPDVFKGVNTRGRVKAESVKNDMLACLDQGSGDEITFEELQELDLSDLKEFAEANGIEFKLKAKFPKAQKTELLEIIKAAMEENGDGAEAEINQTQIMEWVKAKDLESLNAAAEEMGVKLNIIQKKNARKAGEALIAALGGGEEEKAPAKEKPAPAKATAKKEKITVFSVMDKMVSEGEDEDACTKEISKMLKELGVPLLDAKRKAKMLYEIATLSAE